MKVQFSFVWPRCISSDAPPRIKFHLFSVETPSTSGTWAAAKVLEPIKNMHEWRLCMKTDISPVWGREAFKGVYTNQSGATRDVRLSETAASLPLADQIDVPMLNEQTGIVRDSFNWYWRLIQDTFATSWTGEDLFHL